MAGIRSDSPSVRLCFLNPGSRSVQELDRAVRVIECEFQDAEGAKGHTIFSWFVIEPLDDSVAGTCEFRHIPWPMFEGSLDKCRSVGRLFDIEHLDVRHIWEARPVTTPFATLLFGNAPKVFPELKIPISRHTAPPVSLINDVSGIAIHHVIGALIEWQNPYRGAHVPARHG